MEKEYWKKYYKVHAKPFHESSFAREAEKYFKSGKCLIELGCGNGRDSIYFSKKGLKVIGIDQCKREIDYLNKEYASKNLSFREEDFTKISLNGKFDYIYSRFSLHSINEEGENRVFYWSYKSLNRNGLFLFEVRSIKDKLYQKGEKRENNVTITDHYRRFADFNKLEKKLKKVGFTIIKSIESNGLATHNDEDPIVIRFIAKK